jgi:putative PEP-CTERM system integral membrane protein
MNESTDFRSQLRRLFAPRTIVHVVFWGWHAVWVLAVMLGFAPAVLVDLLTATFEGYIPWGITACALGIVVLPGATIALGWRLRHDHRKLFALFYGVAGVGFTLLCLRLFLIRELTAGVALMLVTLAAGAVFYTAALFGRVRTTTNGAAIASLLGHTALLIVGLWVAIVMGLYCVPAIVLLVPAIPEIIGEIIAAILWPENAVRLPFILMMGGFGACTAVVVLGLPFALVVLYTRAWWRNLQAWRSTRPLSIALAITTAAIALWIGAFTALSRQPQHDAFARLAKAPADLAAQDDNLAHTEEIRQGLLNAALAPYRYWAAEGNNRNLASIYREAFHTTQDWMPPQRLFNVLAAPLLYDGEYLVTDRPAAEINYERFFDRPMQDGERDAMMAAVSATYDRSDAEAGLLDVGNRTVHLVEQELSRTIDGDVASFELHEIYENQTQEQQEAFYYFNLPERAAITGLWLGDGPDRERRFVHQVAPRGAAQKVYRQEREGRVDPALLEQVGPRQYRLRVFPIPQRGRGAPPRMHMWMTWTVLAADGGWPMPRLAQARNVYWDDDTRRTLDGAETDHEGWLPMRIDGVAEPSVHEVVIAGHRVRATPALPDGHVPTSLAVVVDTSLSMAAHAEDVQAALARLRNLSVAIDVYVAPSPWSAERPHRVALADFVPHYYGGHTHEGVLADFASARGEAEYGAVIVLTDAGSFAFMQGETKAPLPAMGAAPIWMVHFGGLPYAYRDEVVELVRASRGGVATSIDGVLDRMESTVVDGYRWEIAPSTDRDTPVDAFVPIAASALVGHLGDRGSDLDAIHVIAVAHDVVTPWSSMIVLVDDRQREALKKASQEKDRFDREAESGVEHTTKPHGIDVEATPEPHEWMLLGLAALGLLMMARARRRTLLVHA